MTTSITKGYVNIDEEELEVDYFLNEGVEEGKEGRYVTVVSLEVLEAMLHKIGYRKVN